MSDANLVTVATVKRPRRQYAKGFKAAIDALLATNSPTALRQVIDLQQLVFGADSAPLDVYYVLAGAHRELGEFDKEFKVLEELLAEHNRRVGGMNAESADIMRLLANSYEKDELFETAANVRRQVRELLVELLGDGKLASLLASVVEDQTRAQVASSLNAELNLVATAPTNAAPGASPLAAAAMRKGPEFPKRGEVYWVRMPQYPNDPHQPRPAVVVSSDHRNSRADKVQVVPLTSKNNGHPMNVVIPRRESGLQHDSTAKCGDVTGVLKCFLESGPAGRVSKALVDEIAAKVQACLE